MRKLDSRVSCLVVTDGAQDFSIPFQTLHFSAMKTCSCRPFTSISFGRPIAFISLVDDLSNPSKSSTKLKHFLKSVMIISTHFLSHDSSQCLALQEYMQRVKYNKIIHFIFWSKFLFMYIFLANIMVRNSHFFSLYRLDTKFCSQRVFSENWMKQFPGREGPILKWLYSS